MRKTLAVVLGALALLALRAALLWWPISPGGGLQIMDHAPLYFLLSVAYCICAGFLSVALWASSPWMQDLVYWWAAVLTCLGTALLLYDPFGRDSAGPLIIALEAMGVVAFIVLIGFGPQRPTEHEMGA